MDGFHGHRDVRVTIDSVATGNMIRHWRETPWMSNYIKCSVRPAVRWLFSASGGRRDTKNLPPWHHGLYIRGTCCRGSWCRSACRDPFYGERERVLLGNGSIYTYGSKAPPSPLTTVRRAFVFRASNPSKDCLALRIPGSTAPRRRSPWFRVCTWAPYWCTYFTKSQALPAVATIQCRFQCCAGNTHTKPVNRASNA